MRPKSVDEIYDFCNIPEKPDAELPEKIGYNELHKHIFNYYDDGGKSVNPLTYTIDTNSRSHRIKTLLGTAEDKSIDIQKHKEIKQTFSNYSEEILDKLGVSIASTWNGKTASINYNYGNDLQFATTDYYTSILFSRMLLMESAYSYKRGYKQRLRDTFVPDVESFSDRPWFCTGSTGGGILCHKDEDDVYEIVLAERSTNNSINKGLISIVPNGKVTPKDLRNGGFAQFVKKRFQDEAFNYRKKGEDFFEQRVESKHILSGWNLIDAKLSRFYLLEVDEGIDDLASNIQNGDEFKSCVRLRVDNVDKLFNKLRFDDMSPSVIAPILESISHLKQQSYGYQIRRNNSH